MSNTVRFTMAYQIYEADQFTFLGRTVGYFPADMKLAGADRMHSQSWQISGGISAQPLSMLPLGPSAVTGLLFFLANQPVDVRLDSPSAAIISAVTMLMLGAHISALYVTTSNATKIQLFAAGGSAAVLTCTLPNP